MLLHQAVARAPEAQLSVTDLFTIGIGPTVWELEGPMPMVKRSVTLSGACGARAPG